MRKLISVVFHTCNESIQGEKHSAQKATETKFNWLKSKSLHLKGNEVVHKLGEWLDNQARKMSTDWGGPGSSNMAKATSQEVPALGCSSCHPLGSVPWLLYCGVVGSVQAHQLCHDRHGHCVTPLLVNLFFFLYVSLPNLQFRIVGITWRNNTIFVIQLSCYW